MRDQGVNAVRLSFGTIPLKGLHSSWLEVVDEGSVANLDVDVTIFTSATHGQMEVLEARQGGDDVCVLEARGGGHGATWQ